MSSGHVEYLKRAIEKSKESFHAGNFPAGGIVIKNGEELASSISSPYPGLFHADSKAISQAFEKYGPLRDAILYVGLEPCLMCQSVAYWAGIRDVYYAVPKAKVSGDYYESYKDTGELTASFNEPIRMYHIAELENEALEVIRDWEKTL